jgi:metal-responsive CopG/Arc/MetJ family transcriptional regulator
MAQSSQKRRISVTIDAELLTIVDQLTDNRSAAFEEALHLWRAQKIQSQLQKFYQARSQAVANEEEVWVADTQDAAIAHWDDEFPWDDQV